MQTGNISKPIELAPELLIEVSGGLPSLGDIGAWILKKLSEGSSSGGTTTNITTCNNCTIINK
jgi:hypothetical protein